VQRVTKHICSNLFQAAVFVALALLVAASAHGATPGAKLFLACQGCHSISANEHGALGPSLHDLVGRKAGSAIGFDYSDAMIKAGKDGLKWTPEALDRFLAKPSKVVPSNKMTYPGLLDPAERRLVIEYITAASTDNPAITTVDDPPVPDAVLALQGDVEYGEYLGSECVTCHQSDGSAKGIPPIIGWQVERFVRVMHSYKKRVRENPVMRSIAGALGAEEIAALAAYFKNLK